MKKITLFLSLMVFLSVGNLMAQKKPFTIADIYKIHYVGDPVVSPNGSQIAFTVTNYNMKKGKSWTNIYIMDADGKNKKEITNNHKSNYNPIWTSDGKVIYYVSTESGAPQVYSYSFATGKSEKVTDFSMGIDAPILSPNNKLIAFAAKVYPQCGANSQCNKEIDSTAMHGPVQAYVADHLFFRHWTSYSAGKVSHIIVYNIDTKTYTDVTPGNYVAPTFMLGGGVGYNFSPDSKELCYVSKHVKHPEASTNSDLFIVPVTGGKSVDITKDNLAWDGWPVYSPDGKYIGYRMQKIPGYESDLFRLAVYNRETGKTMQLTNSKNFDNWVDDFKWSADSKSIYFTGEVEAYEPVFKVNLNSDKITQVSGPRAIYGFDIDHKGNLYYLASSIQKPGEIYKMNMADHQESELTAFNKKLEETVDIRPGKKMWVMGADGKKVEYFVVTPHNFDPNKKYPMIINVHGGPQMQWMDSFRGDWQVYPGAGYVVAFPNPHGSTGYGQAYTAEISGDWGGANFEDDMKVTDALAKLPYVDSTRMGAMGWSFGGYMMDWFQGHTKRFKCLAAMMGVYDLRSMWGGTEELWFPNHELKGQPWNSKQYEQFSPSYYAKNFSTPTLVLTGQKDFRVPYTQSIQYFTTLQTLGVPSRLIIFKNDGHWPNMVKSMPLYYDAHLDWFHKYLGGAPAPYDVHKMAENQAYKY
jgi:dipeptidyl aminopeptidase/acylaminoacyl peptidase